MSKKTWQEDVTSLFEGTGIKVSKPVIASFGGATYEFDKNLRANWLYYAFLGFLKLVGVIKNPELIGIIGAGAALDGVAIYETLHPEELTLIDVNRSVLPDARKNLRQYFSKIAATVKWQVVHGNLCGPLKPGSADMIYGNVPTLPGKPSQIFAGMNSSSFYDPAWITDCPIDISRYYLPLQYEMLRQDREKLKPGGSAVMALGVRVPARLVTSMFQAARYDGYEALILDLKEQSQPKAVVTTYAGLERAGDVEFDYYVEEAFRNRQSTELHLADYKEFLAPWRVSAQQALQRATRGEKVYHVVSILRGVK